MELMLLTEQARQYRKEAQKSLERNKHMNEIEQGEQVQQRIIDAVLTDFINYLGMKQCLDFGLYTEEIKDCIEKDFDYKSIKTFNDACNKLSLCHENLPDVSCIPTEFRKSIIAHYKLMIIFKAINNGWKPDWSDRNQYKYYPWFEISSSGFGFSNSVCLFAFTDAGCGSRLCVPSSDIAKYIGKQFEDLYKDFLL